MRSIAKKQVIVALALVLGVAHGAWAQMQKVKIAVSSRGIAFIDLYIAEHRGFFREEGLEPELIQVAANVATAALTAGEVDALGAVGLAARASQSGLPIKVLAVTGHRALFWLVSKPEFKTIADLKGTSLGITSRNGSQHLVANRLLASGGLDPSQGGLDGGDWRRPGTIASARGGFDSSDGPVTADDHRRAR